MKTVNGQESIVNGSKTDTWCPPLNSQYGLGWNGSLSDLFTIVPRLGVAGPSADFAGGAGPDPILIPPPNKLVGQGGGESGIAGSPR